MSKHIKIIILIVFLVIVLTDMSGCTMHSSVVTKDVCYENVKDLIWAISPSDFDFDGNIISCGRFSSGLAMVCLGNNNYVFTDKNGKNAFPGIYSDQKTLEQINGNFTLRLPWMKNTAGDSFRLNIAGREVLSSDYTIVEPENTLFTFIGNTSAYARAKSLNNKYGLINRLGQWIVAPVYDSISFFNTNIHIANVSVGHNQGYITSDLRYIKNPMRDTLIGSYINGYALISRSDGLAVYYNFIDMGGNVLLAEDIVGIIGFSPVLSEGIIVYKKDHSYGYMNMDGDVIIEPQYHYASKFSEGLAYVEKKVGRGGYIDISGNVAIAFRNSAFGGDFENGMAAFSVLRRGNIVEGIIDVKGKWIIKPQYSSCVKYNEPGHNIWELHYEQRGLVITDVFFVDYDILIKGYEDVKIISPSAMLGIQGDKSYYIDVAQRVRYEFDWINFMNQSEGLIAVLQNSLWGFIDFNGNLIIDYQFDVVQPFSEGLAAVKTNGKWGYIANPLTYSSWESDEISRAKLLNIIPESREGNTITCGEFAILLERVYNLEEGFFCTALLDDSVPLTRGIAAQIISSLAYQQGVYYKYFLPDCDDRWSISEGRKFQIGFAIQAGIIELQDYYFYENNLMTCDEAYRAILRIYEYSLR